MLLCVSPCMSLGYTRLLNRCVSIGKVLQSLKSCSRRIEEEKEESEEGEEEGVDRGFDF